MSLREMMAALHLQHRGNFLKSWLNPALQAGFLRPLYPAAPKHPQQKYLLTPQGRDIYLHIQPTSLQ